MTTNSTHIRCGQHGEPLFFAAGDVFCAKGCDLSWSDLRPEVGEKITTRDIGEIFAVAVVVEHADEDGPCPLHDEPLLRDDRDPHDLSCVESGFSPCAYLVGGLRFAVEQVGGGCTALVALLVDGSHLVLSDGDGSHSLRGHVLAALYSADAWHDGGDPLWSAEGDDADALVTQARTSR